MTRRRDRRRGIAGAVSTMMSTMVSTMVFLFAVPVSAQSSCAIPLLPAYAHNDYANDQPLQHAIALGYRGVEVDVFLVDGVLRVGHSRDQATQAGSLEDLYLVPLRERLGTCGALNADRSPFLLFIEIKERSMAAYEALALALNRDPVLVRALDIVLVGWHPEPPVLAAPFSTQLRIANRKPYSVPPATSRVRLISLDYGKTLGRFWVRRTAERQWLTAVCVARKQYDGETHVRAHNVPTDSVVYRRLLAAGITLIGTKDLAGTARVLRSMAVPTATSCSVSRN